MALLDRKVEYLAHHHRFTLEPTRGRDLSLIYRPPNDPASAFIGDGFDLRTGASRPVNFAPLGLFCNVLLSDRNNRLLAEILDEIAADGGGIEADYILQFFATLDAFR